MSKPIYRTRPIKSLTIFLSITFVVSLSMVIGFIFLQDELWVIRILVWVLCGLFTIASGIVLINQLFFHVGVDEEHFYRYFIFGKHSIPLKKIERITNSDGFYTIFVRGKKVVSFATNTSEAQQIIVFLEKKGIKIDW